MPEKIGLLADRGLPEARVKSLFKELQEASEKHVSGETPTLDFRTGTLPMDDSGSVRLADSAPGILRDYGWDRLVYVTDLPLTTRRPVISQTVENGRATMLCLPAFGFLRAKEGLRQEMSRLVCGKPAGAGTKERGVEEIEGGDVEADSTRVIEGRGRTIRLLLGMIRANRPGKLIKVLSSCLATGVATGGFGIFYGSVWEMSYLIAPWRLVMITLLSISLLTFWLVYKNGLWNSGLADRDTDPTAWWRNRLDNAATAGTVLLSATGVYALIFISMLLVSATVVPIQFFENKVHADITIIDYLTLAWFAASLGTLGGALGSSFDTDESVREATYNRRVLSRSQITGLFDDS
ncbi:MAG TPA: hypothetical protein H9867_08125 [Candidatus Corynebacterium gallistercoris]|uniref:5,10-methylene-tetrahydrofolate dehydrogenase n=1 Tax=Candidatus Corynebacterium gallistercoris TaxID=2838530 RepID=A0A9D1RXP1_9CORY|nr:hypothetical protein [Candidatus Corynebacterium gallistercoris]